jgi:hypothetical protein
VTDRDPSSQVAGFLVMAVGLLNLGFGVLSLATDQIRLSAGVAGGLVVAGLVTVSLGALVWRGSRNAAILATTVFAMLLVFQVSESLVSDDTAAAGAVVDDPTPRLIILGVLVVACGVAAWRLSRRPTSSPTD